jgi:hypothetical protein
VRDRRRQEKRQYSALEHFPLGTLGVERNLFSVHSRGAKGLILPGKMTVMPMLAGCICGASATPRTRRRRRRAPALPCGKATVNFFLPPSIGVGSKKPGRIESSPGRCAGGSHPQRLRRGKRCCAGGDLVFAARSLMAQCCWSGLGGSTHARSGCTGAAGVTQLLAFDRRAARDTDAR